MKKESLKVRFMRWWYRLKENKSVKVNKPRGSDSSKVKGSTGVQSTLDKLNRK